MNWVYGEEQRRRQAEADKAREDKVKKRKQGFAGLKDHLLGEK